MKAFNPISPTQAAALVEAAGISEPMAFLTNNAVAGLVKGYARWMERLQPNGAREEIRDKRIAPELWRRIIAEGRVADVFGGTVRLDGSTEFGGGPKYTIVGIRFDDAALMQLVAEHGNAPRPPADLRRDRPPPPSSEVVPEPASAKRTAPDPAAIPSGAILCTIKQAGEALGFGRTKVNELMNAGRLERKEIDGGVRITVSSVKALAGSS